MSIAIGVDLGTTNTVVAAVVDGVAVTLEDEQGRRLLPSIVSFHPSGTVLVGEVARERRLIDPENTISSIKPLMGRAFDSDEVAAAKGRFPFQLTAGAKNSTMVLARDVAYALPEISAFVLRRAKAIAEAALGEPVERAVITVPANFNDLQRASTKIAGKLAGLEVMRILNEPTAAALAYGQSIAKAEKLAVYDLGGGTFDVTLLDLTGSVFEVLATAGDTTLGGDDIDRALADRIAMEVLQRFRVDPRANPVAFGRLRIIAEEVKKDLSTVPTSTREVSGIGYTDGGVPIAMPLTIGRDEMERIARPFLDRTIAVARQSIEIIGLNPKDFDRVLLVGGSTRMPLVWKMVEELFGQPAHLKVNPDEVVALGAAIQAHALNRSKSARRRQSAHEQLAKAEPLQASSGDSIAPRPPTANPNPQAQEAVPRAPPVPAGMGMGEQASPQFFQFSKAPAVITFSPPPPPPGSAPPVAGPPQAPQRGPAPRAQMQQTAQMMAPPSAPPLAAGEVPSDLPLAPDLALPGLSDVPPPARPSGLGAIVAAGDFFPGEGAGAGAPPLGSQPELDHAAFQRGSAIETAQSAPLLIDVTPLSLRVETVSGYSDVLIAANSPVPCEKTRAFMTASDGQTLVTIRVAQGESQRYAENTHLGELELTGLKAAPRGELRILVTFALDADGILNVRAKEQTTNRETKAMMRLLGGANDAAALGEMAARQARHVVA